MNFLLLRGAVPTDRNPNEIIFNSIGECDDVWSTLFWKMFNKDDCGEIWYYGTGPRKHRLATNLVERWILDFRKYIDNFVPDVIFCRGGFPEYHHVLKKFSNALSIRYGAGRRYLPCQGFYDYNLILQDSVEQLTVCRQRFPNIHSSLFIKPAPDNLFYPMPEVKKEYDICFPANASQVFKGHSMVYTTVPSKFKLLNLGNNPKKIKYPSNVTSYRVIKSEMPEHIAKCKIGIVAVGAAIDSCPRIIPELLACNLPIVVLDTVRFWKEKYIVSGVTGELATVDNFWAVVEYVLNNLEKYNPRKYYEENLSLEVAAKFLRDKIDEFSF